MRFRAAIENVPTFFRIIQAIEKLQRKCIIKFTEADMQIICNDDANEGGVQVWSQIRISSIFTNYRIQSNASNEITVSLPSDALLAALKSALSSSVAAPDEELVVLKLAKKNDRPVLSFEVNVGANRIKLTHNVPIEVLKPADVKRLTEPLCPEPDIHILLPSLQKLRVIVDKLRPMSEILAIRANNSGNLELSISTESVKCKTQWSDCKNPGTGAKDPTATANGEPEPEPVDPEKMFTVLVSVRSFLKFLNSHVVSTTTIACICQHHCMILYVYIGDIADAGGVLTFYVPAVIDDEER